MILPQNVSKSSQFSRKIYITNISIVKNTIEENEKVIKSQSLSPKAPGDLVQNLVLPPTYCVTWAKLCLLSEPQLNENFYLWRILWGLNEHIQVSGV